MRLRVTRLMARALASPHMPGRWLKEGGLPLAPLGLWLGGRMAGEEQEADRQPQHPGAEPGDAGQGGHQHGSAGVAEFAADLSGAHSLAQPPSWRGAREGGEAERGDQADTNTNRDRGGQQPGQPGDLGGGDESGGRQGEPGGHAGWDGQAAGVGGAAGPRLDEGGGQGEQGDGGAGGQRS